MRFLVTHLTAFHYDRPVHLEPHVIRLRPRSDGTQRLSEFDLKVFPAPAGTSICLDQDGNSVTQTWFERPIQQLRVETRFEVETLRQNAFDFLLPAEAMALGAFSYAEPRNKLLAAYTDSATIQPFVKDFAHQIAEQAGCRTMPFLAILNRRLFDDWRQVIRPHGAPMESEVTLQSREGSCRDIAVLFCDACRAMGLAARFVSGYQAASVELDHPYMHAWAEVYLPGGGWRGYDPTRGLAVSTDHIAVAAAASPALANPISGSYRGEAQSRMEVAITMRTAVAT